MYFVDDVTGVDDCIKVGTLVLPELADIDIEDQSVFSEVPVET